jgi:hypothetical protein
MSLLSIRDSVDAFVGVPGASFVILIAITFIAVEALKRFAPATWAKIPTRYQPLPALLLTAAVGAIAKGADASAVGATLWAIVLETAKGAIAAASVGGLGAIGMRHTVKRVPGDSADKSPPSSSSSPTDDTIPPAAPTPRDGLPLQRSKNPGRFATLVAAAFACLALVALTGCGGAGRPAESPARATLRGAVLGAAHGARIADSACADYARSIAPHSRDRAFALARDCDAAYGVARGSLMAAEYSLDSWSSGAAGEVACSLRDALEGLGQLATLLKSSGLPPAFEDALTLAKMASASCTKGGEL